MNQVRRTSRVRRRSIRRAAAATALLGLGLAIAPGWGSAQAHRNPAVPDSLRQIQSMEPRMGPPGTEVRLYSENLPLQARVVIGLGKIGEGFEELGDGAQGEFGEIGATVRVPRSAMWDRAVVFIVFNGNFAPTGLSDPFHVTDEAGRIRREGTVAEVTGECVHFEDRDGYKYTLSGASQDLRPGDRVLVDGAPSRTVSCSHADTIEVARLERLEEPGSSGPQ